MHWIVLVHVRKNLRHIRFEGFWHKRLLFNLLPMRFSLPVFIKFIQNWTPKVISLANNHLCHQAPTSPVIVRGTVPYSALLNSALQKAMTTDKITLNPWALFCVVSAFCPRALNSVYNGVCYVFLAVSLSFHSPCTVDIHSSIWRQQAHDKTEKRQKP